MCTFILFLNLCFPCRKRKKKKKKLEEGIRTISRGGGTFSGWFADLIVLICTASPDISRTALEYYTVSDCGLADCDVSHGETAS